MLNDEGNEFTKEIAFLLVDAILHRFNAKN
jgi:hypothetical protein